MVELTPEVIATVKATAPVLAQHGAAITSTFYPILFETFPETKVLFNQSNQQARANKGPNQAVGAQPQALANAVYAYAANIDNLGALSNAVTHIAHKHASLHVLPEHYPMVGQCLLKAIKTVLGDAANEQIMSAWAVAYGFLADIFIKVEGDLRRENEGKDHGYSGFKFLVVKKKVQESVDACSFYFEDPDGQTLPPFKSGQYVGLRVTLPSGDKIERDYSLSDSPGPSDNNTKPTYYRITMKKIPGGVCSNYFHERVEEGTQIEVSPPYGEFQLLDGVKDVGRPIVMVSAGTGVTPLMSMLNTLTSKPSTRPVYFIHGARNGEQHIFGAHVRSLAQAHDNVHLHTVYSQPRAVDTLGKDYDSAGHITIDTLAKAMMPTAPQDCTFYFCGPVAWMIDFRAALRWLGVQGNEVHYECFGPEIADIETSRRFPLN